MSRRTILLTLGIVLIVGLAGASYVGWRWYSKDRVAVGTYRLDLAEGVTMAQVAEMERVHMASDDLLRSVIAQLDLMSYWKFSSEEEALAHMRAKLVIRPGKEDDALIVIYRDRSEKMALDILRAISDEYLVVKRRKQGGGAAGP